MDFGCGGGSVGGGGGGDKGQGERLKRKWRDLDASMKAMKVAVVKENAEKSAKICRLMEDNILLKRAILRSERRRLEERIRQMSRQNPFAVFPPEVWEAIIEKMIWPSDLNMLCLAIPQLEPLVIKRKQTIVLFKNVLPLVSNYLVAEDIKNCRLVCASWNEDVCTLLANWKSPNLLPEDDASSNNLIATKKLFTENLFNWRILYGLGLINSYNFGHHSEIQDMLNKVADHRGNPLLGRFLSFCSYKHTGLNFWECVLQLVETFGKHVWNLEMRCDWEYQNQVTFYKTLQENLIHLPNLKYLAVDCDFWALGRSSAGMAVLIGNSPLPPLPHLQSLKLAFSKEEGMSSALSLFFTPQIRRLELRKESFTNLKDECIRGLINVEDLEVELHSKNDVSRLLKFPNPNLKKLCLHAQCYPAPPVSFTSEQFASLLEKFSRLEHRLDINRCQVEPCSPLGSRMRFSELKTLEIEVGIGEYERHPNNLDFLLSFSSLEHLVIEILFVCGTGRMFQDYDKHSVLKMRNYMFEGQMLASNIWTLMPSLELLETKAKYQGPGKRFPRSNGIYTREMFENRKG